MRHYAVQSRQGKVEGKQRESICAQLNVHRDQRTNAREMRTRHITTAPSI